jgi:hypothetical protein
VGEGELDVAAWARAHHAAYELGPLVEMVKGRPVQVGFTISLYARLPLEAEPGDDRRAKVAEIGKVLREILQSLVPAEGGRARLEIDGPRAAVVFEPGAGREPEVDLTARVFHAHDYFAEATADEEGRLRAVARRLADMGLQARSRRP